MAHRLSSRATASTLLVFALAWAISSCGGSRTSSPSPTSISATPVALSEEFHGALDCVSVQYPTGWKLDLVGALSAEYPSLCPGFPRTAKTEIFPRCDKDISSEVWSALIILGSGDLLPNGGGRPFVLSLDWSQKGCPDPKGDAKRRGAYIAHTGGSVIGQADSVISAQAASCAEYNEARNAGHTLQCFFDFDGGRYVFGASAPVADWSGFSSTAYAVRDSVRLKAFPICGSTDFPAELANFCP
jgi:hypothetical protein